MHQRGTAFCCFLWSEGVKPIEIHQRMEVQYGEACLSLQQVYKWSRKFLNGVSSLTDSPRPGQAHQVVTPEAIAAVEAIVKENRRVTVHEIAAHLDMSHGSAHSIVHEVLQFHQVSARWVPCQLTAELEEWHVDACQELLKCFEAECNGFLGRIVTGDETWVHYHQPETKKASKEWRHTSSPKTKKFRTQPSAGKVTPTLLGWTRGNFGALHAQGEHCDQCNVCRSPQESPASCNQVQMMWTSEYRCFVATWQCSAPYCPFNCCNNPRSVLRVSSTSAVLARPRPQVIFMSLDYSKRRWEASLSGPMKRCRRRCTSGCTLSQKTFFLEVSMHFRSAGTLVWNAMETT